MKLQLQKNLILISVLTLLFTSSVFAQEEFEVSHCSSTIDSITNEKLCGYGDTRQEAAEDYCGLRFGSTSATLSVFAAVDCELKPNDLSSDYAYVLDVISSPFDEDFFIASNLTSDNLRDILIVNQGSVVQSVLDLSKSGEVVATLVKKENSIIAIGLNGEIRTSLDGVRWLLNTNKVPISDSSLTNGWGSYVLSGAFIKENLVVATTEGVWVLQATGNWTHSIKMNENFGMFTRSPQNEKLFISSNSGVWFTNDGVDFEKIDLIDNARLSSSVVWDGNRFVVLSYGSVLISEDGISWEKIKTNLEEGMIDLVWTGDKYVAVGHCGSIMVSTDAVNWESVESNTSIALNRIITNGESLITIGNDPDPNTDLGVILTSDDGLLWNKM